MNFFQLSPDTLQWFKTNGALMVLSFLVLVQWIALQVLCVHYHLYRSQIAKRLKGFAQNPGKMRFHMIEKSIAFQSEQMESIFRKMAEFRREVNLVGSLKDAANTVDHTRETSLETSFVTLGEMNLKKRLSEMKRSSVQ